MTIETSIGLGTGQPYPYQRVELVEPDWTRFPGWKDVTAADWASVQWQRAHCVKNPRQLRQVTGPGLAESFFTDLERDQRERATMSMLLPPQMLNTMVPDGSVDQPGFTDAFYADPQWADITDWRAELDPYYAQATKMLGVTKIPAIRL